MEHSIFIARILSLVYLAIGVGMLLDRNYYRKMMLDWLDNPSAVYLAALIALVVGFLLVTYHNLWVPSWVVIITVLGWMALIKGVCLLAFPRGLLRMTQSLIRNERFIIIEAIGVLILGGVLGYFGFVA